MVVAVSRLGCSAVAAAINRPPETRTIPLQRRSAANDRLLPSTTTLSSTLTTSFAMPNQEGHRVLRVALTVSRESAGAARSGGGLFELPLTAPRIVGTRSTEKAFADFCIVARERGPAWQRCG